MIHAFIVAVIAAFLAYLGGREKNHSYLLLLAFTILTLFLSLGYYWGNDVATYERWYEGFESSGIQWWDFSQYESFIQKEYGFICINLLCKPIGFWGMRAVLFILENAIIYFFIKKHIDKKWRWLAVYLYVFNPYFWVLSSSMMRQWLAICIILLSIDRLLEKRYLFFAALVFLASTIHVSASICLVLFPLALFQNNATKKTIVLFFVLLVAYYILSPLFIDYLALYLKTEELYMGYTSTHGSFGITSILLMVIYTIVLYFTVKTKQKDSLLSWIVMLYGLILPLLSFGELSSRLFFYFTICTIGSFPLFLGNIKINKMIRTSVIWVICLLYLYQFYIFFHSPTFIKYFGTYNTLIGKI